MDVCDRGPTKMAPFTPVLDGRQETWPNWLRHNSRLNTTIISKHNYAYLPYCRASGWVVVPLTPLNLQNVVTPIEGNSRLG